MNVAVTRTLKLDAVERQALCHLNNYIERKSSCATLKKLLAITHLIIWSTILVIDKVSLTK